jgi:iron complex outermembrane receptor protein
MLKAKKSLATLLFLFPAVLSAQFSIKGKVSNKSSHESIAGATVNIQSTFIATQSKSDGSFEITDLKKGTYIIRTSFIGFLEQSDTVILNETNETNIAIELTESPVLMDEIIVSATRIDERTGVAFSELSKTQIEEQNLGQDLPYLLNQLPSVVTTSDAGAGVGYTGIRMRGVDATRLNVTINGIPVNDAESQGAYWVDLPDIASSIDNIQVQRGVGTSTNGAGAFGGSLNIQTTKLNPKGYGEYNSSYGSFNTFKNTVNAGSGLINDKFSVDARLSKISSDGFIDRASSDLKSYYLSGAYYGKKSIIKFITFSGLEETYQAWNGIPESLLKGDVQKINDYIIRNGLSPDDALNLLNSDSRTYNQFTYQNQVDHYKQDYYQLHFSHEFNRNWNMNLAMHFTKGKGYYEEYKRAQPFSSYGLQDITIGGDTISQTDLVRRKWLDNNFYGTTFSTSYSSNKKLNATIGGAWNKYDGLHYGEIIWAQYAANSTLYNNYYKDTATKTDFNIFAKMNYAITTKFSVYADLQYRLVNYSFLGYDDSLKNIQQTVALGFINPKIGLHYEINSNASVYFSYSVGHKEPSRDDYTQSTPTSRPKAETLNDIELGFRNNSKIIRWALNAYYMEYKNQLVLTGEINNVGAYNRTNVSESYRNGLEAEFGIKILKNLSLNMNATFSQNKINNFVEYIDNYDSTAQRVNNYSKTDIAFSPNIIAAGTLTFEPVKNLKLNFICKYVGKQYMDNTHISAYNAGVTPKFVGVQYGSSVENSTPMLGAYFTGDLRINYTIQTKYIREIGITLAANNIFNELYESNGYTYSYIYGGEHVVENFYYPQAGMNFTAGLSLKF